MIDDLLARTTEIRNNAQELRRRARKAETDRADKFDSAAREFQKAIDALEPALRAVRRQQNRYSSDACRLLKALSQTYGSLGGTWRDAKSLDPGNLDKAQKSYERGNEYEEELREQCKPPDSLDTYNMLQCLVIRLLRKQELMTDPEFRVEMKAVQAELIRQKQAGRRDSWALADMALVGMFLGDDAESAAEVLKDLVEQTLNDLEQGTAEATFYESAYYAVSTLVQEGLGMGQDLGNQLKAFMQILQRKGGIAG